MHRRHRCVRLMDGIAEEKLRKQIEEFVKIADYVSERQGYKKKQRNKCLDLGEEIMKKFNDENFLLENETAKKLYFEYAKDLPIIDYHCHLSPKEIYEDLKFKDLTEVWLKGDHYKWRVMRAHGIDEERITGSASNVEKFKAWAETVPYAIGNPLYHWTHMELKTFFGIEEALSPKTDKAIYEKANQALEHLSARKLMEHCNVEVVCTTDDPTDSLEYHLALRKEGYKIKVYPAFRPDKALNIELPWFLPWLEALSEAVGYKIDNFDALLRALSERIEFFDQAGCRVSDHALDVVFYREATKEEAAEVFRKKLAGEALSRKIASYKPAHDLFGKKYHEKIGRNHIGALRDVSKDAGHGTNTIYDAINIGFCGKLENCWMLWTGRCASENVIYTLNRLRTMSSRPW